MSGSTTGAFGWTVLLNPATRYESIVLERHKRQEDGQRLRTLRIEKRSAPDNKAFVCCVRSFEPSGATTPPQGQHGKGNQGVRPAA